MTLADAISPAAVALFNAQARPQVYAGLAIAMTVVGFNREQHVFRDAVEGDRVARMLRSSFEALFPSAPTPRRLDKVEIAGELWTVQGWHGAPPDGEPVFYVCLLRGGSL